MAGKRRIDRILDEGYLADLGAATVDRIREMRAECAAEEATVSYERRLLQGRIDLVKAELHRRETGEGPSLVELLPQILADEGSAPSRGALPMNEPDLESLHPNRRLTKLVSNDDLLTLKDRSDEELKALLADLQDAEREVSALRRPLLAVLDALNVEIANRYRSGEAQPSDVLSES